MKRTLMLVTAIMIAGAVTARPAQAKVKTDCIDGCNADFPGTEIYNIAIRGWCYILRGC
jgi:hypothetical protein